MKELRIGRKEKRMGKTIRTWLITFIIVFIVQFFCWFLATEAVSRTMRAQTDEAYQNALNVLASSCDNDLSSVYSMLDTMVLNEDIKRRCGSISTSGRNLAYQNELVRRQLVSYKIQHVFIDDIFIYLGDTRKIISSNTVADVELFYDIYGDVNMSREDWEDVLVQKYYKKDVLWENQEATQTLYILHSWLHSDDNSITLVVKFKDSYFQDLIERFRQDRFAVIAIQNDMEQQIVESGEMEDKYSTRNVSHTSSLTGWTYTAYISQKGVGLYGGSTLIVLGICFTAVTVASATAFLFFFRTNVNPVRELLAYINSHSQEKIISGSEYVYIKEKFDEIIQKQKADEREFENQMNLLKMSYLRQILNGSIIVDGSNRQLLEKMQLEYLYNSCGILLFFNGENLPQPMKNNIVSLEEYGIGMLQDNPILGCSFVCDNMVVCIFRLDHDVEQMKEKLKTFSDALKQDVQENGIVAISSLNGVEITKAYEEAKFVMQSARQLSVSGILFYDDIQEKVKENARENKDDGLVRQVREYIELHYSESDLTIEMLCAELGKSVSYLSKIYKERTGQNILYDLNLVRIERAKQLLQDEDISIDEIGHRVGFISSNSFIRVFKKYENMTPGNYKERFRAGMY